MLTITEYNVLWETHFSHITTQACPGYNEYWIRENMLEDYLDLFRGRNTRSLRAITPTNCYYEHPFFDGKGNSILKEKPCIKYILIAEACPENGSNYFYDIREIVGQKYLIAAYNAIYNGAAPIVAWATLISPNDKVNKLIDLAKRGVLLLDLFPFALNYNKIREQLNISLVTDCFFNNVLNLYSVTNRIHSIINEKLTCHNFKNQINSVFIAPPKISYYLAHKINSSLFSTHSLIFKRGFNSSLIKPKYIYIGPPNPYYNPLIPAHSSINHLPIPISNNPTFTIQVPIYACTAYSGAGTVPHSFFITISLI
jgi:hypothetical protein